MIFDVRNNIVRHQQKWQGIFPHKEKKKKYCQKLTFSYMGAELEKGRNLLAETSGGQIRKGPKPLATLARRLFPGSRFPLTT